MGRRKQVSKKGETTNKEESAKKGETTNNDESAKKEETTGVSHELNKKLRMEEKSLPSPSENENDVDTEDGELEEDCKSTKIERAKRGKTIMHCLAVNRAQGIKQDVIFNNHGQPVAGASPQMQSYIGVLVREKVNICYDAWKDVPSQVKERIWESVNLHFNVDPKWKMGCFHSANSKWRQFKSHLTRKYIFNRVDNEVNRPPDLYPQITPSDWSAFVISRLTENFKAQREEQQERRSQNKYPHGLAREGYGRFARRNPHLLCNDPDTNQAVMWAEARKMLAAKADGKADGKALAEKLNEISEIISKKKEGLLEDSEETILESVLGKPEHSGRLRGVGSDVTPTMYYKVSGGKDPYSEICQRQQKELIAQNERIAKLEAAVYKLSQRDEVTTDKGSCTVKLEEIEDNAVKAEPDLKILEDNAHLQGQCVALSLGSGTNIAGYGMVMDVPHNTLPKNCMCVAIDEVVDENAFLPVPTIECKNLGDAVGSHIAWPIHLLKLKDESRKRKQKEKQESSNSSKVPVPLRVVYQFCKAAGAQSIAINIQKDIFGEDITVYINFEDVEPFYLLKPIDYTCIVVYMWHLYKRLQMVDRFRFVNPYFVGYMATKKKDKKELNKSIARREKALIEGLLGTKASQLVLVPCNVGYHWILTVIDPHKLEVGLMDPLQMEKPNGDWQRIVETALQTFHSTLGDAPSKSGKNSYWPSITAPKQPDYEQCGFYVMRYMKDIIESDSISTISSLKQWFKNKEYSVHDIDEVRHEWATFVQEYIGE